MPEETRQERLARREEERRARSEGVFNRKRWTHAEACSWIAYRSPYEMLTSPLAGILHDVPAWGWKPPPIVDRDPGSTLTEAIVKGWVTEFVGARGHAWYESENVRAVFRDTGGAAPPPNKKPSLPRAIADFLLTRLGKRRPSMTNPAIWQYLKNNARAEDGIQKPSLSSVKRTIALAWPEKRRAGRPREK